MSLIRRFINYILNKIFVGDAKYGSEYDCDEDENEKECK